MTLFSRMYPLMTKPLAVILFALSIILSFVWLDRPLAEYFASLNLTQISWLFWLTNLGVSSNYIGLFLLGWLFFLYLYPHKLWQERCLFLLLAVLLATGLCLVLKTLLGRARPELWLQAHEYGFYWLKTKAVYWSFPSGHTITIMTVAFSLCLLFPAGGCFFIFIAILVAVSRLLLVKHYLTDVLVSSYLALIIVGSLLHVLKRSSYFNQLWDETKKNPQQRGLLA